MTDSEHPGLRERRRRETTEAIQAAALDLFEEKGLEETTIAEIAARAGIGNRTFFRYFEAKEDAALPAQRRLSEAIAAWSPTATTTGELVTEMHELMRAATLGEVEPRDEHRRVAKLFQATPLLHTLAAASEAVIAQKLFSRASEALPDEPPVRLRMVVEALVALWRTSWWHWGAILSQDPAADPERAFTEARTALREVSGFLTLGEGSESVRLP